MKIDIPASDTQRLAQGDNVSESGRGKVKGGSSFSQMLSEGLDRLNSTMEHADRLAADLSAGGNVDVPDAMIAITKADVSFRMFLQVRNKALGAYEEIMRLQF